MDNGRLWALEIFGEYGPNVREQVAAMVRAEHVASLDAQEASGHRSRSVYGEFWRGLLERFEAFGALPGGTLVRPGEAPYKLPVINGVVLFPWRFARSRETELADTRFTTSGARVAVTTLRRPQLQGVLDVDLPDPGITQEERQLLEALHPADPAIASCRLVVVAVASSVSGLFKADWGEARLTEAGSIEWVEEPESLLSLAPSKLVSTSPTATFTDGKPPSRFPNADEATAGPASG